MVGENENLRRLLKRIYAELGDKGYAYEGPGEWDLMDALKEAIGQEAAITINEARRKAEGQ